MDFRAGHGPKATVRGAEDAGCEAAGQVLSPLVTPDGKVKGTIIEFWRWAYSDLISNAERGTFSEYLVACALGISNTARVAWDKYDLISPEGITIEIKTSGYVQTWEQKELSKLVFGIPPTLGWDSKTNEQIVLNREFVS